MIAILLKQLELDIQRTTTRADMRSIMDMLDLIDAQAVGTRATVAVLRVIATKLQNELPPENELEG